ncbi:MAG TPA: hypothetical protein DCX53_16060 [Anaerolineae bacterium]|nr:hypothetical protein [Anaerolineae bacterium]
MSGKFCPICKNKNKREAGTCKFCGAQLTETHTDRATTTRNTSGLRNIPKNIPESFIDYELIPKNGVALYAAGASKPSYLHIDKELIIGRKEGKSSEKFLDLSDLDSFNLGLSRRHAVIRHVETGYEVIDLSSTNGSWLNNERLVPNKPYKLGSGAQMRFGLLQILIIYHSGLKPGT